MKPTKLEGNLLFFSETGTEGGYWAFQDSNFMALVSPEYGVANGIKVWDINDQSRFGFTSDTEILLNQEWLPYPDPMASDPDYLISSLYHGEAKGNFLADKRLMDRYKFKIKYSSRRLDERGEYSSETFEVGANFGSTPTTEPNRPYGLVKNVITKVTIKWDDGTIDHQRKSNTLLVEQWDYKGLHILKNGDRLKILHPGDRSIVWDGTIELKSYDLFSEETYGMWIHADQIGISREVWSEYFINYFPAQLTIE